MILRDKLGWPVVRIKGRPIVTFLRLLIHTNIRRTWADRHQGRPEAPTPDASVQQSP